MVKKHFLYILFFITMTTLISSLYSSDALTSITFQIKQNNKRKVIELLKDGVNLNQKNDGEPYPLFAAIEKQNLQITQILLENGANPNLQYRFQGRDTTALQLAVDLENHQIAVLLLNNKANPNKPQRTPLHIAAKKGNSEIIKLLLNHTADPNAEDAEKNTPLHEAAAHGNFLAVKTLVEYKPNLTCTKEVKQEKYPSVNIDKALSNLASALYAL